MTPESPEKRAFLRKGLVGALYALAAAAFAQPVLSFVTFRKTTRKTVRFAPDEQLAAVNLKDAVFLMKGEGDDHAFSARCPHLGCTLRFDEGSREFRCPCHGSVFDRSGNRVSGPARKGLARVPVSREKDGTVVVTVPL
jgi:Rieske Fe-S protein